MKKTRTNTNTRASVFLLIGLWANGCCSCRDRYAPFLEHVEVSLRDHVAPSYEAALKKAGRPDDLAKNDLGELTDLADACERIRTHGAEAWQAGSQEGAE